MAFGDGILESLGLKTELSVCPFRIFVYGDDGFRIEGADGVEKATKSETAFRTKKTVVRFFGDNLRITRYGDGEAAVVGKVEQIKIERKAESGGGEKN